MSQCSAESSIKGSSQPSKYNGLGWLWAGIFGGLLVAIFSCSLFFSPLMKKEPVVPQKNFYVVWTSPKFDKNEESLQLLVNDMVEKRLERVEERLRDHFTLLIAISGIAVTLILGVFGFSQYRREDIIINELNEKRKDLKDIFEEPNEKKREIK